MSDKGKPADEKSDIWDESLLDLNARMVIDARVAMTDPSAKKIRGRGFSQQDQLKVRTNLKKMTENSILPFLKNKIRVLEENVSKTHKGVKNRFISALGLKTPERGESDGLK